MAGDRFCLNPIRALPLFSSGDVIPRNPVTRPPNRESGGGTIATNLLDLGPAVFWYPRQNASDPHQVILNLETPADYEVSTNATLHRDLPNNTRRLRTWIVSKPAAEGITRQTP